MSLGEKIRAARVAAKLSQAEASQRAGIRQASWSDIETGKQDPTSTVLRRIARALRVSPGELLQ